MALPGFADIRPEERRDAWGAFLALFGILSAHTLLETARDALFLARLPPSQLPWVYLAMAVLAVALSQAPGGKGVRAGRFAFSLLLAGCAAVTFGFWLLGASRNGLLLRGLYVWTGIVGTLTALQFWLVLGERYTITQAKRLYKVIGVGSVLGAAAGTRRATVHLKT
jgi:ATP/ADP translocase